MKNYLFPTIKHGTLTWILLTLEIIVTAILYASLNMFKIATIISFLLTAIAAIAIVFIDSLIIYVYLPNIRRKNIEQGNHQNQLALAIQGQVRDPADHHDAPIPSSTSYQGRDTSEDTNDTSNKLDTSLKIENMLLKEFNYASATAYQAMEDRARFSSFYYVLVGVLATGLAAIYQFSGGTYDVPLFLVTTLLVIGALISICFFVTLIRLRQAYKESLLSMNVIKEYYIVQYKQQMPTIEQAFRWRLHTMPKGERVGSVTFMFASLNAIIGSLCLAGAVFLDTKQPLTQLGASILAVVVFIVVMMLHILYYRRVLSKRNEAQVIHEQMKEMETMLPNPSETPPSRVSDRNKATSIGDPSEPRVKSKQSYIS